MAGTRDAILDALEELTADELKKFKLKLQNAPMRDGYSRIPRGALQRMDAVDLADRLVSCYLEAYAAELTAQLLRDMGMQEAAEQLQARSRARGSGAPPAGMEASALRAAAVSAPHFMDRHREALVRRVTDVSGVLDALHGRVLSEEQYQAVRAEATNQDKMRKLFSFAPAWNLTCKDLFLQALRDTQPYLVDDLEGR
ncbi:apoptosis-associated speck-like protein containing a CARD isoform X2 [Pipistrellus kuhlii]|uniref:Apoptosis-associated speck-like protein containing a CARD n=1 Tax=Pipistrellus kuhlii TaxID=59472 RepID=A0A7J7S630_PIPKU|nr:apoptosis-associated speck-like protein containing a CARD isoform X2 [Pipistrellus kuhlii]KAF6283799.1 PYD and CARD domain containing [Pipistrellus kuhlii]